MTFGLSYRIIRAVKNRFGAVNEISVFAMSETGLKQVENPSAIFLSNQATPLPGSMVMVVREATRPLLIEPCPIMSKMVLVCLAYCVSCAAQSRTCVTEPGAEVEPSVTMV
jgi:predicted ATP-dependent serine protease